MKQKPVAAAQRLDAAFLATLFWVDDEGNEIIVAVTSSGDGQCVATGLNYRVDIPYMLQWIYDQFPGEE